jgi:hypothetical protein
MVKISINNTNALVIPITLVVLLVNPILTHAPYGKTMVKINLARRLC